MCRASTSLAAREDVDGRDKPGHDDEVEAFHLIASPAAGRIRKKHGIDFRTAAKVFLDPYVIEFDDHGATGERRFNAIGLVDVRMLFVAYALRGDVVRGAISSPARHRARLGARHAPARPGGKVLLAVIAKEPDAVAHALAR
jgi:uncharacterized DUF497 family protein